MWKASAWKETAGLPCSGTCQLVSKGLAMHGELMRKYGLNRAACSGEVVDWGEEEPRVEAGAMDGFGDDAWYGKECVND